MNTHSSILERTMPKVFQTTFSVISLIVYLAIGVCVEAFGNDAWTQWRGPHRDGRVTASQWPSDLSEKRLSLSWSVPQGPSYSGPIVSADHVFVTETKDAKYEVVRALDRSTGQQVWETQWTGSMRVPFFAASNGSWIRATPALDGERLYVAGMKDVLVCLDANSGNILWKRDFVADTGSPLPQFGFVSSPLVIGDHIFVQAGASFVKLDKFTGEVVWQALKDSGGMHGSAFSSPVFATIAGVPQFVVQTRSTVAGVEPEDGTVLWSEEIPAFRGMNILTPTVIGDAVFTSSYGGRSSLFSISRDPSGWKVDQAWSHKSQGYMSSPVVIDGHIYLHLRNQRLVCIDAKTGDDCWTTKPFGKYWSMVANGDKLLVLDERGELLLIQASPDEFKLIDRRQVADESWAHVAIVADQIFVRDLEAMKAFAWN
jgi:outer membrane protein assembly factor BamB